MDRIQFDGRRIFVTVSALLRRIMKLGEMKERMYRCVPQKSRGRKMNAKDMRSC